MTITYSSFYVCTRVNCDPFTVRERTVRDEGKLKRTRLCWAWDSLQVHNKQKWFFYHTYRVIRKKYVEPTVIISWHIAASNGIRLRTVKLIHTNQRSHGRLIKTTPQHTILSTMQRHFVLNCNERSANQNPWHSPYTPAITASFWHRGYCVVLA